MAASLGVRELQNLVISSLDTFQTSKSVKLAAFFWNSQKTRFASCYWMYNQPGSKHLQYDKLKCKSGANLIVRKSIILCFSPSGNFSPSLSDLELQIAKIDKYQKSGKRVPNGPNKAKSLLSYSDAKSAANWLHWKWSKRYPAIIRLCYKKSVFLGSTSHEVDLLPSC